MSRYSAGARRENAIKDDFESAGWYCVRSAGSKGIVDVVALKKKGFGCCMVRLIQSKKAHYLTPDEKKKIQKLEKKLGVEVEII